MRTHRDKRLSCVTDMLRSKWFFMRVKLFGNMSLNRLQFMLSICKVSRKSAPQKKKKASIFGGDTDISVWKHILKETSNSFSRFDQLLCKASYKADFAAPCSCRSQAEPPLTSSSNLPPPRSSHAPWHPPHCCLELKCCLHPLLQAPHPTRESACSYSWWIHGMARGIHELVALSRPLLVEKGIMQICVMSSSLHGCRRHFLGKAELAELKVALTFFMLMCYFDNYQCQRQKITSMPAPVFFLNIKNWVLGHL